MKLEKIDGRFTVCKVDDVSDIDLNVPFLFLGRTDEEISLVCPTEKVPPRTTEREDGWMAFRIKGVLDFSLVGILARIASILAENGISIFAVSTFNTDYVLVKEEHYERALKDLDGLQNEEECS